MRLYHGSNIDRDTLSIINDSGLSVGNIFDGVFCSVNFEAAESHGDFIFEIAIDEEDVLTNYELNYELSLNDVEDAFKKAVEFSYLISDMSEDDKWSAIIEDEYIDSLTADESWECQRLRGRVAGLLGYTAVEMRDEHGTSYLVTAGILTKKS